MNYIGMNEQEISSNGEENIAPGRRIGGGNTDMQQSITWHAQISIQTTIHDQACQLARIPEDCRANPKAASRDRPENHNIRDLPAIREWELTKVGPPEKQPE